MSKLSGAAFDKMYMTHMVKDHKKDVAEFEKEASKAKDSSLKNFAQQTLPTLREHLQMAQTIAPTVGATGGDHDMHGTSVTELRPPKIRLGPGKGGLAPTEGWAGPFQRRGAPSWARPAPPGAEASLSEW